MFKPTAFVLLAGLVVAQPPSDSVTPDVVKRLARRLLLLDPGNAPPITPEQLDALRKLLDTNPELKKQVEQGVEEFKKLSPDQQRSKLNDLKRATNDPAIQKQLDQIIPNQPPGSTADGNANATPPGRSRPTDPPANPDTTGNDSQTPQQPGQLRRPGGRSNPMPPTQDGSNAVGRPKPPIVDHPIVAGSDTGRTAPTPPSPLPPSGNRSGYEKFARLWEQNVGSLKDMPAVRQLAQELFRGRADSPANGSNGPLADLIDPKSVDNLLKGLPEVGREQRGSSWRLPEINGMADALNRPAFTQPTFTAPTVPTFGGIGFVVGLFAIAAVLFAIFRLIPRHTSNNEPLPVPGLGPWPLDPRTVQTRADLVRAFEYLSVLLNGNPARAYSHEAAAAAIRQAVPSASDAAAPLADAYALARYTPTDQPLSEAAISDARRHLCRLAGVPAV